MDLIAVKGRAAAVRVYTLLGDNAVRESTTFRQLAAAQDAMLAAYRDRNWPEARAQLARCRDLALTEWALDDLYDLYETRIATYNADPPPADWDGVYVAETK